MIYSLFLDYIDGHEATDELLKDIDEAVYEVKHCETWKEEYKMLSMDHYTYWKEGVAEGIEQGIEQGLAVGTAKAKAEVVVQMLHEKLSLEMIAKFTKLSLEEITAIGMSHGLL